MNLEKAIELKNKLLNLKIQKFADTFISEHSTLWQVTNSSTHEISDARPWFDFYYSQDEQGNTIYKMIVKAQTEEDLVAGNNNYDITAVIAGESFRRTGTYYCALGTNLTTLFTVTKTVACNSDGTGKQIAYSIYGQAETSFPTRYGSTYYFTPPTVSLNAKLGTISSFTIGTDFTVPATIYNSSYTHTLTIKIGSTTVATRTITSSSTTITFSSSELTTIYNAMTTTNSTTFTFELVTMNGSTQIGSTSTTTATGTLTNVTPVISNTGSSISTSALSNQNVISGYSSVTVTFKATPQKNATITSAKVNGASATAGSSNDYSITINKATTGTFKIEVTDSRGNIATSTITKTLINYITLTLSAEIKRTSSTGSNITMTFSGNYWSGNFGMASNVLKTFWNYREKGTTDWTFGGDLTPTISGTTYSGSADLGDIYDYTKDYEFQVIANDQLNYITTQYQVSKGLGILELYQTTALVNGNLVVDGTINATNIKCKNLIPNIIYGMSFDINSKTFSTSSQWAITNYIEIEPLKEYTFSQQLYSQNQFYVMFDEEYNYLGYKLISGQTEAHFTVSNESAKYIIIEVYNSSGITKDNEAWMQLEEGSTKTSYIEHKEFSNKQIYNNAETVVGRWLGKPLYRKVFKTVVGSTFGSGYDLLNTGLGNIDELMLNESHSYIYYNGQRLQLNWFATTTDYVRTWLSNEIIRMNVGTSTSAIKGAPITITLEYTKTTD